MSKIKTLWGICLTLVPLTGWALLGDSEQTAKEEGMIDYNLGYLLDAIPKLEVAAEAGDVEAMYYLGESHRIAHMGMTREALDWYHLAAQEGDPYAMLRLESGKVCALADVCPENGDNWAKAALEITLPKAEEGDLYAMGALFNIYGTLGEHQQAIAWLEKSAEAGNPHSQHWLGTLIYEDRNFTPDNDERHQLAEEWFRQAAVQGYVPAMLGLNSVLSAQERFEEAWEWGERAADKGSTTALLGIANCYINPRLSVDCIVTPDPIKGWAVLEAMQEVLNDQYSRRAMRLRHDLLTDEQREEAREAAQPLVEKWSSNNPALSNFPEKYGF
ncbi:MULTISPECIES: tetratricopeptide repeat protein [unclassified Halomonas]|uniref:tetratricopeptide repeat protein n=1 Tax=unclassified Halomonas TaxID=2609666 RepID=UPI0018D1F8D8|nr:MULTISPECIES: tetratricopeptide repeat protein [unclassified Halomonas]QPP47978.1 sel1 repeat family protein [Halomonas sp. SS10-MC5]